MQVLHTVRATADHAVQQVRLWLHGDDGEERGQGMVEYALILMLIAIVVILIVGVVGRQVQNVFSNLSSGLAR